jgi:glyoxylase-like metal-dependent hydrolase (beta-lactamase superfamily II)
MTEATTTPAGEAVEQPPRDPAWAAMPPGVLAEVAPGVRRLVAPNPGIMTGPGTNTYLVGDAEIAVIDPGPDDTDHLDAILEAGADRIRWILVTHTHVDHSPLTAALVVRTGAPALGFGPAPDLPTPGLDGHDRAFRPDRILGDDDRVEGPGFCLTAVHTPGHATNHLCYELTGQGLLFSGDHVMQGSTVVIAPPDGDMADYLESLEKIRRRGARRIAPGHGEVIEDPAAVLDGYLNHRMAREAAIAHVLAGAGADGMTVEALVAVVYAEVPAPFHPIARYSVWAHLRKLAAEGRATSPDPVDLDAPWRPSHGPSER